MIYLSYNNHIRKKVRLRHGNVCDICHKKKRLLQSILFFTHRNQNHWSNKRNIWIIDWDDYRWVCRDCVIRAGSEWRVCKEAMQIIDDYVLIKKSIYGWSWKMSNTFDIRTSPIKVIFSEVYKQNLISRE